ncbi:thiazolylpeptide-type bacteriocin [Paenibacillus sambharensis]|uniref:Thiazolylpeptide-type bacteriocin n=1 Tax=Paenibacillus sambharensis TaxID=1803190 RepID=A0A2W1LF94_9BACL|nr:thiazolylpeptide-type bacteriocin [Paenibacillus sambharensis]
MENTKTVSVLDDLTFEIIELDDVTALPETAASSGSSSSDTCSTCGSSSCSSCSSCT